MLIMTHMLHLKHEKLEFKSVTVAYVTVKSKKCKFSYEIVTYALYGVPYLTHRFMRQNVMWFN